MNLILAPNPILQQKCTAVRKVTKDLQALGLDLIVMLKELKGLGLAAPQVGRLYIPSYRRWKNLHRNR